MLLFFIFPCHFTQKTSIFCTGWFRTTPRYILTKCWHAKIDIFDITEKNVILYVFKMSALGTTLMTLSI